MKIAIACVVLMACGGKAATTSVAEVGNTSPATTAHAPCFADRATIPATELFAAVVAGSPGTCTLVDRIPSEEDEGHAEPSQLLMDGNVEVAAITTCGIDVLAAGITDPRGVEVGADVATVVAAYPLATHQLRTAAGLGGETQLFIHQDELDVAYFELDGMGPPGDPEGEDAVAAVTDQRVASFFLANRCD